MMTESVTLKVLRVDQPIGDFYIGAVDAKKLIQIATTDVRQFLDDKAQDIAGIQRQLSTKRVNEISEYAGFEYATFPTSVILAVDERCVSIKENSDAFGFFDLEISAFDGDEDSGPIPLEQSAFIIDGQHRLAGLRNYPDEKTFELNVSIFVGLDMADKAEIFSTVNLTQTKVNRSLVLDLYAYHKRPSPFKTAHEVTIALDQHRNGPLHKKIKRLGITTPGRSQSEETLSQATVVRGIMRHMPSNPHFEKNKGFLGRQREREPNENWKTRIFVDFYRQGDTEAIFNVLTNYFLAVEEKWPSVWTDSKKNFILNRTNGFNALIKFLGDCYLHILKDEKNPRVVKKEEFSVVFSKIEIPSNYFVADNIRPGSSGSSFLYKKLLLESGL